MNEQDEDEMNIIYYDVAEGQEQMTWGKIVQKLHEESMKLNQEKIEQMISEKTTIKKEDV